MEIKIFTDGEPSELKPLTLPKQINENMEELSLHISSLLYNVKLVPFMKLSNNKEK